MAKVRPVGGRWSGFVRSEMNARFVTRLVSGWPIIETRLVRSGVGEQFGFKESTVRSLEASRDGPLPHSVDWKELLGLDGLFQFNVNQLRGVLGCFP